MKKLVIVTSRINDSDLENIKNWAAELKAECLVFFPIPENFYEVFQKEAGSETYFLFEFYQGGSRWIGQQLDNSLHDMGYKRSAVFGCGTHSMYNSHNASITRDRDLRAFLNNEMQFDEDSGNRYF